MANKDDVYIKDGHILRGDEAVDELLVQDMKELIRDSGLESRIKESASRRAESAKDKDTDGTSTKSTGEGVGSNFQDDVERIIQKAGKESRIKLKLKEFRVEKPAAKSSAEGLKCKAGNIELTGTSTAISGPKIDLSAQGANVKALNVDGKAITSSIAAPDASVSVQGANVKTVNVSYAGEDIDVGADVGVSVNAADIKAMNMSAIGEKVKAHASAMATAKMIDAKVLNVDLTRTNTAAEAEAVATAKGFDVKAGNASFTGVQKTVKVEAQAAATGVEVNVANAKVIKDKWHRGAGASAEAKGIEVQVATANVTDTVDKSEVTCEARAGGWEFRAANVSVTRKKTGNSAKATVKAQGAEVQAASVNVQGEDSSVNAQAELKVGAASAKVGTVNVTPKGGTNFQAKADLTPGINAFNVNVGTHKGASIGVSTKFQVGNVGLSSGPPNLIFGPGLNLSLGGSPGSSEGKSSGSGGSHAGGEVGSDSHYTTDGGRREPANISRKPNGQSGSSGGGNNARPNGSISKSSDGTAASNGTQGSSVSGIPGGYGAGGVTGSGSVQSSNAPGIPGNSGGSGSTQSSNVSVPGGYGGVTGSESIQSSNVYSIPGGSGSTQSSNVSGISGGYGQSGRLNGPRTSSSQGRNPHRLSSGDSFNRSSASSRGRRTNADSSNSEGGSVHGWIKDGSDTRINADTTTNNDRISQVSCPYAGSHKGRGSLLTAGSSGVYRAGGVEHNLRRRVTQDRKGQQSYSSSSTEGNDSNAHDVLRSSTTCSKDYASNSRMTSTNTAKPKMAPTNPTLNFGQLPSVVEDPSLPSGRDASLPIKRGFGSTHRRSEHHDTYSSTPGQLHKDGNSSNGDSVNSHTISARQAVGKSDEKRSVQKEEMKYGEKLAKALNETVQHLKPEKPKQEKKTIKKDLPSTRDEAKRELRQRLETFRKDVEDHEAQKCGKTKSGFFGSGTKGSDHGKGVGVGSEGETETTKQVESTPKQKPFGAKRNIHTLGCFQNESSRSVTKLHGQVHGFDA